MKPPRGLSPQEAQLWAQVARTVTPLAGRAPAQAPEQRAMPPAEPASPPKAMVRPRGRVPAPKPLAPVPVRVPSPVHDPHGLDSHWERKLAKAAIAPDYTLDLHGATLDGAHARLDNGLAQAVAMGARLVLLITGRPRPVEAADRGSARGAIRAKILDWMAHGPHAGSIAAVRPAHRRHGGAGALYLVLKRPR